ncbi:MAG TPA: acyltransferase [Bradyrhizobium sp.]|nr:acyltransferase [Bradyrhizobium sp.]
MKASNGAYYQGLDHIRGVAAILVYCWHVLHFYVPPQYHPFWMVLSWFEEGHTGIALFMALSGYLFAKLTDGQEIDVRNFLWNRACRLLPLFAVMYAVYAATAHYTLGALIRGVIVATEWPGASWSLAIELQFYLVFPALHWLRTQRGDRAANATLIAILVACVVARAVLWFETGSVEYFAYWSILGRADQLVMGMLFYELSKTSLLRDHRGALLAATATLVLLTFHWLNLAGGCFDAFPQTSSSSHWVWLPLFEGASYGCLIMCYDTMSLRFTGRASDALARLGELSYSIYMIHSVLVVGLLWPLVPRETPLPVAVAASAAFFPVVVLMAQLSYAYIEKPFLRFRRPYLRPAAGQPPAAARSGPAFYSAGVPSS